MNDIYSTQIALERAKLELEKEKLFMGVDYENAIKGLEGMYFTITPKTVSIEKVIYNNPATVVYWSDKTKTVVKCQPGDEFDKERGLALAVSKKFFGNKSNFNNQFKRWCAQ
jgi:hypothetical protein